MRVPIPPPSTMRPPPPDPRASSTFSLSLLPCQSIYFVSSHAIRSRLLRIGIERWTLNVERLAREYFRIWAFAFRLSREALAHRNYPGRTRGFLTKTRRAFLSREAGYRLDLQKTRRLVRRDDGFA